MPDPTAHADDMKSLAVIEPNTSPAFWWLNPWGYALSMKRALDAVHLLSEATEDAYQAAKHVIKQKDELADYHRNNLNAFQRKVELTLKPVFGDCGYEDTIDLVDWAAEEIKTLRAEKARCAAELLETKETVLKLVDGNERAGDDMTKAEARIKELEEKCRLIHGVHQGDVWVAGNHEPRIHAGEAPDLDAFRFGCMHLHEKPKAKRKPKRAVLAEDKTTGKKLLAPKKKAKYGDARDEYSAIGRRYLKHLALVQARRKAIAKAKKKGGRRA